MEAAFSLHFLLTELVADWYKMHGIYIYSQGRLKIRANI